MIRVLKAVRRDVLFHVRKDVQKDVLYYPNFGRLFGRPF